MFVMSPSLGEVDELVGVEKLQVSAFDLVVDNLHKLIIVRFTLSLVEKLPQIIQKSLKNFVDIPLLLGYNNKC